jgi:hypothetical protein
MEALYRREREHGASGSAASSLCVSAVGVKRGGVGGCCGLRCAAGESWRDGRGRDGLVQRGTRKWAGVFFSSPPCLTSGVWAGETGGRQQGV